MSSEYLKQLPQIDSTTRPYWDAAKQHELMAYKCMTCGTYYWPAIDCMTCNDPKMEWVKVNGIGVIYTFIVYHQVYQQGWKDEIPYNVCWVKLNEGPIMLTNIVGCKNEDLYIGMPVEVTFEDVTDEVTLPKFKPLS